MEETQHDKEFALADLVGDLLNVAYDDKYLTNWLGHCAQELNCTNAALLSWESGKPDSQHSFNYGAKHLANTEWCEWFSELLRFHIPEAPCLLEDLITALFNSREYAGDYDLEGLISMAPALSKNLKVALISWRRDIVVLVLERENSDDWTQQDAQRIRFIAKHLASANKVLSHVYNCRWGATISSTLMDASPRGLSVLGPGGHVGYATSGVRIILELNDGLALKNGKLRFNDPNLEAEFYKKISEFEGQGKGTYNTAIKRPSGKPPFQLMLVGMTTNAGTQQSIGNQPFLTVFIHNPSDEVVLSTNQLQKYFSFTKAEANVARAVFEQNNLQQAADSLNISINTVRTHLRKIYEKANVSGQSELMLALSGALRVTLKEDSEKLMSAMISASESKRGSVWRLKNKQNDG